MDDEFKEFAISMIIVFILAFGTIVFLSHLFSNQIDEKIQDLQAERDIVESMSCEELKDAMLYNQINGSDNRQRATERFLEMGCQR